MNFFKPTKVTWIVFVLLFVTLPLLLLFNFFSPVANFIVFKLFLVYLPFNLYDILIGEVSLSALTKILADVLVVLSILYIIASIVSKIWYAIRNHY